jgi:hypothetical protein
MKWAIIMAAIAARIERLKHLHRTTPEARGESELTPCEIAATVCANTTPQGVAASRIRGSSTNADDLPNVMELLRLR